MSIRIRCAVVVVSLVWPFFVLAENLEQASDKPLEVVVTANHYETPIEGVASSITVIGADELEAKQEYSVAEAIKGVNSVDVVQSGGPGSNVSVFMRGANSEHTLVLIDGVEANNPITPNRLFNMSGLSTDNIERIEVLRGPQSTLYGSDAMGGVINIITKKGEGAPTAFASAEAGSYASFIERAGVSGGDKLVNYSLGASRTDTQGISAADSRFGNSEHDGYKNSSVSSRIGITPAENIGVQFFGRYYDAQSELDNSGGFGGDDPNRLADDQAFFGRGELNLKWLDGKLKQNIGFSYSGQWMEDNNDPDEMHPLDMVRSRYDGDIHKVDLQNIYKPTESITFIGGLETQVESGNSRYHSESFYGPYDSDFSERSATTNSYYLQGDANYVERFYLTGGLRVDSHSKFGSEVTYRFGPAIVLKETGTKLSSTIGSGFKAPSLYQLYSIYGSQDLEPEKSVGVDAGIEQALVKDFASAGVTYFHNTFDNLITFDPNTFIYSNVARARTDGIETYLNFDWCDDLSTKLSYTYTNTKNEDTGESLLRRPRNKFAGDISYKLAERASLTASINYIGASFDEDYSTYPASRVRLGGYTTVDLAGSVDLTRSVSVFARIDNLFDRYYEQVFGYGSLGAAAYGGIKVKL